MQYRRDLSSLLKLLALGLFIFVGYQVWLKPASVVSDSPPNLESSRVSQPASQELTLPETQTSQAFDIPASRLADFGRAPNQKLEIIREEIDKGHYNEAERRLRALSHKTIRDLAARRYTAGLWNNLGVQQEKFGGTALSVKAFQRSVAWDPESSLAHLNLTQAYWELRDPAMTPQFLETVIQLAPQDPFPHLALADLLLSEGQVALASMHLKQARARAQHDANHRSYFRQLLAKADAIEPTTTAKKEAAPQLPSTHVEVVRVPESQRMPLHSASPAPINQPDPARKSPLTPASMPTARPTAHPDAAHFTVQFDGPADQATWMRMQAILEYAHNELSQKFGHALSKPLTVVLHTEQKFMSTSGSPRWADTLFDRSSGAIHLPTQGALEDLALFSRVARHQFVQALLFDYAKGHSSTVPTWLSEGLAIHLTEDAWPDLEEAKPKAGTLIPLTSLEGEWNELSEESLIVAYLEAHFAAKSLVDRSGMYAVRQVVHALREGQTLDAAMLNRLSITYEQFRRQWEKDLVALAGQS
jgi:tetratricopeptide (TPR) repeat protein